MANFTKRTEEPNDLHIFIPADIVARRELKLEEKYVLSRIREVPSCGNFGLSKVLGITPSGVEAMMARLRRKGHIEMVGRGKARKHRVLPRAGDQKESGQSDGVSVVPKNSEHSNTDAAPVAALSTVEEYQQARREAVHQVMNGRMSSNFLLFTHLAERVGSDTSLTKEEAVKLLSDIEDDITRFMLIHGAAHEIARLRPCREDYLTLMKAILTAPHRVLIQLRPHLCTASEPTFKEVMRAIIAGAKAEPEAKRSGPDTGDGQPEDIRP